jgi:hypothetical protein
VDPDPEENPHLQPEPPVPQQRDSSYLVQEDYFVSLEFEQRKDYEDYSHLGWKGFLVVEDCIVGQHLLRSLGGFQLGAWDGLVVVVVAVAVGGRACLVVGGREENFVVDGA